MRTLLRHLVWPLACVLLALPALAQAPLLNLENLSRLSEAQATLNAVFKGFNRGTKESTYELSLSNVSGSALHGPVYVTIESITGGVTVKNPSGTTTSGVPYFVMSTADIAAGASVKLTFAFHNPANVRFNFNLAGYATPAEQAPPLAVEITHPGTLVTVGSTPILVEGTINDASATLTLNGAAVSHAGGQFAANVALDEGHNAIVARATNARNEEATATISVSLDKTPPYMTIESPLEGAVVASASISVSGLVNDIVRGTVSEGQANVTVNGRSASVSNRSYLATDVPLQEGLNTIRVQGSDQVGNTGTAEVHVTYQVPTTQFIELLSGQAQQAQIRQVLGQSLRVKLQTADGVPVPNKTVIFRVSQGDGVVGLGRADEGNAVLVVSDDSGVASTQFKLGSRAGSGNNRVTARAVGFEGEVVFVASATPQPGNKVSVNSGNNQRGAANQPLPLPFVIVVTDDGSNVIEGAQVEFSVLEGGGRFQNGETHVTVTTDSDGRANAKLTLGSTLGLDVQRVIARLVGTQLSAGFTASALQSGPPGATSISGVVLDNQDHPLPHVTMRVEGTSRQAVTDDQGRFKITEAPVGPVHLIADGSTTTVPGEWPTLPYNIVTVSGADNPLSAPVYLVKLDTAHSVTVGAEDREVTLSEVPGFKLTVKAGSVTFPNGDRVGQLSVTPVNVSKIPMPPPNGMQPQFIVTLQPTGARFDPPAPLQLPNVDGHPPGAQVEMYSFDHDLEEFVAIGLGTVSADGTSIASNTGVGVIKAGWHCGSPPGGNGCVAACNVCQSSTGQCTCQAAPNGLIAKPKNLLAKLSVEDARPPGDIPHDCKTPVCSNGQVTQVPDPSDDPLDSSPGDCHRPKCFEDPAIDDKDRLKDACRTCDGGEVKDLRIIDVSTLANNFDEAILPFKAEGVTIAFQSFVEATPGCDVQYQWDFDDGFTSSEPNPSHTYLAPGQYIPRLVAKCAACDASELDSSNFVAVPIVELVTPKGDAATAPVLSGTGQNHYVYGLGLPILTVDVLVKITPSAGVDLRRIAQRLSVEMDPIGLVFPQWDNPAQPGGHLTVSGQDLTARARFDEMPLHNADFGNKKVELKFNGVTIETARTRVFYDATSSNHPGGITPNWFYYYRDQDRHDNPDKRDYTYENSNDFCRTELGGQHHITITNNCYPTTPLREQAIVDGKRRFVGLGADLFYWTNFAVVIAHERAHADTTDFWIPSIDPDGDHMRTDFEVGTVSSDPNDEFSCDPGVFLPLRFNDAECWAYGPPEHEAAAAVDITVDWARPGHQFPGSPVTRARTLRSDPSSQKGLIK